MSDIGSPSTPSGARPPPAPQPGQQGAPQGTRQPAPGQSPPRGEAGSAPPAKGTDPATPPAKASPTHTATQPGAERSQPRPVSGAPAPQAQAPSGSPDAGGRATGPAAPPPALPPTPLPGPLPSRAAALPAGASLSASVGAERAVNATVIETAVGRLLLHPPVSFPHGARLDLRIHAPPPAQGAAAAAAVVVAQGRPLPAPVPVLLTGATTPPVPHSGSQPAVPAALPRALPAGGIAVATVETAPPPGMLLRPAAAQISPLPQGTILSVRVAGLTAPQQPPNAPMVPTPQAPGSVVQPQTAAAAGLVKPAAVTTSVSGAVTESQRPTQNPAPAMNTAPVTTTTASAGGTRAASGAAPLAASSAPVGPPPSVSTDPSAPPASSRVDGGRVIAATVIGNAADGRLLVRADGTLIALANRAPLAPETVLRLEILGFERPPAPASQQSVPPPPAVQPLSPLSPTWPALSEVIEVLRQTAPATAQALVTSTVPAANASLLANIMAFLFGVQFGNPRSWLGPQAVQALERAGRGELLARLGDDFTQVARLAQDSAGGDWRMLLFPFFDEGHLHQVRMFLRDHRGGGGEEGEGEQGQRMIVDVDLSRLGRIQLDGLYRHDAFDLVLRSAAPLEEDARRDIVELFTDTLAASGLQGGLTFHVTRSFPAPLAELAEDYGRAVLV